MKHSDDLFHLIKSLKQQEKKYFKQFVSRYAKADDGEKFYVKLFDAVNKQKEYNEAALRKLLSADKSFSRHFRFIKHYLYQLIMKSLRLYHAESAVDSGLKDLLHNATLLYEKDLFTQVKKVLLRAKKTATKHEKFLQLLEILDWEKKLLLTQGFIQKSENTIEDIKKEEKSVLTKLTIEQSYRSVRTTFFKHFSINDMARSRKEAQAYKSIIDNSLLSYNSKALSYNAKHDFYYTKALYYYAIGDSINSYVYHKKLVDFLETHPGMLYQHPTDYIAALGNYYITCLWVNKYKECLHVIKKMRAAPASSVKMQILIFRGSYSRELNFYITTGEFHNGVRLVPEIEKGIRLYEGKIPHQTIATFYFDIAYTYFGSEDYSRSIVWLNKILNDTVLQESRTDVFCFSQILNLIVHYELENMDLLEYIVKSTYRFLYKRKRLYKFENSILNFIRIKLPAIINNKVLINAFNELKAELVEITSDPFEKKALEYFDFISWLESKIENRSFAEVVKEKTQKITV